MRWQIVIGILWMGLFSTRAGATDRPNVVLIMADDFGYECVSVNGGESYKTPHLDRMAERGMRFSNCHVQPLCTPTRVQLMTGIYNVRNYIRFGELDPKATTFANLLSDGGYATGICGKWQLGLDAGLPEHFGFHESCLWHHLRRPLRYANPGLEFDGRPRDFEDGEYGPELVNDWALDFIDRHRGQPFFLYYPMILTHSPFEPTPDSEEWNPDEKPDRDPSYFADMTTYADKMVGRVLEKLDALEIGDETLVIFIGDNGTHSSIESQFQGEAYVGGKGTRTARGTHVPMIVRWPAEVDGGSVCKALINCADFLPTICEAAEVEVPEGLQIDGQSFLPILNGESANARDWSYCWYSKEGGPNADFEFAMSLGYKLYRNGQFFDLQRDPFEESPLSLGDLAGEQSAAASQLTEVLEQFADARPEHLKVVFPKLQVPATLEVAPN